MVVIWAILIIIILIVLYCFYNKENVSKCKTLQEPSYSELLTSPEWIEKRNIILDRDNHKCQYCGKTHDLQVHHKYYSKYPNNKLVDPWNYPDDALITLCSKCHKWIHSQKKNKVYYRKYD